MLKDLEKGNWIIPPWDPRYGKLGHIWKKYDWNSLINYKYQHCYEFYIIPELVIADYCTTHLGVSSDISRWDGWEGTNWVNNRVFKRVISYCTGLTDEQYFLLLNYHSNLQTNYKRCSYCHCKLGFVSLVRGYNSGGRYEGDLIGDTTCSQHCLNLYKYRNKHLYGDIGLQNKEINARTKLSWFLNQGDKKDTCYLYITRSRGMLKYGITANLGYREHTYNSFEGDDYGLIPIITDTRENIANLEFSIKSKLDFNEYVDISEDSLLNLINSTYEQLQLTNGVI